MAHAAASLEAAAELVEAVTGLSNRVGNRRLNSFRDAALRRLSSHPYLSTNPFQVINTLDGLEERFRVNHRDDLADALRERLTALEEVPLPWLHDVLDLLLNISDQPTFKSRLSHLDALGRAKETEEPTLRWEDIAREDGWDDDDYDGLLWKAASYSSDSEDDEFATDDIDGISLLGDDDDDDDNDDNNNNATETKAQDHIIHPEDNNLLDSLRAAQAWRTMAPPKDREGIMHRIAVAEPHMVRDIIFMLQGLPTSLFSDTGLPVPAFEMEHVSWETYKVVVRAIAESGRRITLLRRFATHPQSIPHLQAFQDCIAKRLQDLDARLSEMQARFARPEGEVLFSILAAQGQMAPWIQPLVVLSGIIVQLQDAPESDDAFRYLELLFDETTMAQCRGDQPTFEFLARIFIECFHVYLRPVRRWMDEGKLSPGGNDMFFVCETADAVPLSKIWSHRFALRKSPEGALHVPKFLSPAANQIYNAGKNIVVLRLLGKYDSSSSEHVDEPPLDFETMCPTGSDLATFPGLFGMAFDRWIQSKYRKTSTVLKDVLLQVCGLSSTLDALQAVYLMSEGFAASSLSNYLFDKLDSRNPVWYDRFALTGAAQDAYAASSSSSSSSSVDANRLSIRVKTQGQHVTVEEAQASVRVALPHVRLDYRLAWPVQMVVSEQSMEDYRSVFVFLLQIKRAVYALHKPRILDYYWTDHENWDDRALFYSSRRNLVWFCTTLQAYLSTLVLAPGQLAMQRGLAAAADVDAMMQMHAGCMRQMVEQACLGGRLTPVRECILEMLNLALLLEQARESKEAADVALQRPSWFPELDMDDDDGRREADKEVADEVYFRVLAVVRADFDQHLRFICQGLRSAARATGDSTSAKWDILADMLQGGRDDH